MSQLLCMIFSKGFVCCVAFLSSAILTSLETGSCTIFFCFCPLLFALSSDFIGSLMLFFSRPQEAEWHCDEFTKGACFSRGKSEVRLSEAQRFEVSH